LIQAANAAPPEASLEATKQAMIEKHLGYIREAAEAGAQIACLQKFFTVLIFARNKPPNGMTSRSRCPTVPPFA
jgi:N-carbamoylputrescine amidase